MWIDAHTHLEMLEGDTDSILKAAQIAGVSNMITIGCHPNDFDKVSAISKKYFPQVAATLGVHPHDAKFYSDEIESKMRQDSSEKFIIGIGEIGLDYYYNHSDQNIQRDVFHKQMNLALELGLPVQIHSREAEDDTIAELQKSKGAARGMMHCFSGTAKLAKGALDAGFYISLSGVITFKNADQLREVVKTVPLDRLLVETDAPFLAPIPMRGKKNEPAYVTHTALKVAEIKNMKPIELAVILKENVKRLFPKWNL
jgi:TatD DNase family protein